MVRTEAITLIKEDVLLLGKLVVSTVDEMSRLLSAESGVSLDTIERQEELINDSFQSIEETCLDLLVEKEDLGPQEVRTVVGSTFIAAKLERMADHAIRICRIASWAAEAHIDIPAELAEMAGVVQTMAEDVLVCFISDEADKAGEVIQRDNRVDYLHDQLSKRLLGELGVQDRNRAQMNAQFLFCARFMERMGDASVSIAKRVHFIVKGQRISS